MTSIVKPLFKGLEQRTYRQADSAVFLKTKEAFGGLSNMAGGYSLEVNGVHILTAEALYQACRFPHLPEVQRIIIGQNSPMTAKMVGKPHRKDSRPDWNIVRVRIMRWCLRVKLAQNWERFGDVLLETDGKPIVEESRKDDFWGAKRINDEMLMGINILGRLLTDLRDELLSPRGELLRTVVPPDVTNFTLLSKTIGEIGIAAAPLSNTKPNPRDQPALFE